MCPYSYLLRTTHLQLYLFISLTKNMKSEYDSFQNLPAAHWLHLPDDVKFQIDDALSQFEAGDFQVLSKSVII